MGQAYLIGNETRASESLQDIVIMKLLPDSYRMPVKTLIRCLLRLLQGSYQETISLLQDTCQQND